MHIQRSGKSWDPKFYAEAGDGIGTQHLTLIRGWVLCSGSSKPISAKADERQKKGHFRLGGPSDNALLHLDNSAMKILLI